MQSERSSTHVIPVYLEIVQVSKNVTKELHTHDAMHPPVTINHVNRRQIVGFSGSMVINPISP